MNQIKSIKTSEYRSIALRPKQSILNHEKIEKSLNIKMPFWQKNRLHNRFLYKNNLKYK